MDLFVGQRQCDLARQHSTEIQLFLTIKVVNSTLGICLLRGLGSWLGVSCKVVNEIG